MISGYSGSDGGPPDRVLCAGKGGRDCAGWRTAAVDTEAATRLSAGPRTLAGNETGSGGARPHPSTYAESPMPSRFGHRVRSGMSVRGTERTQCPRNTRETTMTPSLRARERVRGSGRKRGEGPRRGRRRSRPRVARAVRVALGSHEVVANADSPILRMSASLFQVVSARRDPVGAVFVRSCDTRAPS